MKNVIILLFISLCLMSCKASKFKTIAKNIDSNISSDFYENQFTGFFIYDPETNDTLYKHNSDKYFTPASNTKIFTLYSALKTLPDSIPSLKYSIKNDTLYMEGTGDPSFLHPYFKDSTALKLTSAYKKVGVYLDNFQDTPFGPGWAWEDYDTYFSPERSGFPMYGNIVEVSNNSILKVEPVLFKDDINIDRTKSIRRDRNKNRFYYNRVNDTIQIPLIIDNEIIKKLWNQVTPNKIFLISKMPINKKEVLYSISSDSLYKRMMAESDNFLAEQILILASSTISDILQSSLAREHILKNYLSDLKHPPRWVDGSGLSRYNLFTPESFVHVLKKMYTDIPKDRLFNLFPATSVSGTFQHLDKGDSKPFIYAKSGSLGNNYNLSGYIITKSGKTLIFSIMNNHFTKRTSEVKRKLSSLLKEISKTY